VRTGILLNLCIISFILAACAPIGFVGADSPDDFWTVPRRQVYDEGNNFVRADDLWVFVSAGGVVQKIDVKQVTIKLIKNPNVDKANPKNSVSINSVTPLTRSYAGVGRKLVTVSYKGLTAEYSIEIQSVFDPGPDGPGFLTGDDGELIWWEHWGPPPP
jgi:hypothetical protein